MNNLQNLPCPAIVVESEVDLIWKFEVSTDYHHVLPYKSRMGQRQGRLAGLFQSQRSRSRWGPVCRPKTKEIQQWSEFLESAHSRPVAYIILKGYDGARSYEEQGPDSNYGYGQPRHSEQDFKGKRLLPSEPSPHVIFLGLDPDFTEADVCSFYKG